MTNKEKTERTVEGTRAQESQAVKVTSPPQGSVNAANPMLQKKLLAVPVRPACRIL